MTLTLKVSAFLTILVETNCDIDLENSKVVFPYDTLAQDDASPY